MGVPVIAPEPELNVRPAGNAGLIENVIGAVPPLEVTGAKAETEVPRVRVVLAIACVVVRVAPLTARVKVLLEVVKAASVATAVKVEAARATVGVPVIAPEPELNVRPAGNAGLIENVIGAVPPLEVTGAKAETEVPRVRVVLAITCVVVRVGNTLTLIAPEA